MTIIMMIIIVIIIMIIIIIIIVSEALLGCDRISGYVPQLFMLFIFS